ncbi:unnamed protein product [Adineta ricciae]|uniref:Uncharacterized protein n=1 Tax=Adineta ricciae TaxID=249248 RepID=A0A816F9A9_ADIRI|nr:unnamed protein product [Adineta ricciae]
MSLRQPIRILHIPPYYDNHLERAISRLISAHEHVEYQLFTIDKKHLAKNDLNLLLSMSRTIIQEEQIQMLIADSCESQLIVAKLGQEYPQLRSVGMNFLTTLHCFNRLLMIDLFGEDQCVLTLNVEISQDLKKDILCIEHFFDRKKTNGYVKSSYSFGNRVSSSGFATGERLTEMLPIHIEVYEEQYKTNLQSFFQVYLSQKQYPSLFKPSYLIQPFYDLTTYPYWRLVIANACIFDKEIIMWPLVDGYSGWPFFAQKPIATMPIMICPSRHLSAEQQNRVYTRFREHLDHLISNERLRYGWIESSYFVSTTNEIRLISMKPTYSVYLTEAFSLTNEHGNPISVMIQLANRQRPLKPILNGKTVYIHRLWAIITQDNHVMDNFINMSEIKRIHRSNFCLDQYAQLCFQANELIPISNRQAYTEIGFIQVNSKYHELGLTNLIEFRSLLLKTPQLIPFSHQSMLANDPFEFDPVTCLPSSALLSRLDEQRKEERRDLI